MLPIYKDAAAQLQTFIVQCKTMDMQERMATLSQLNQSRSLLSIHVKHHAHTTEQTGGSMVSASQPITSVLSVLKCIDAKIESAVAIQIMALKQELATCKDIQSKIAMGKKLRELKEYIKEHGLGGALW